MLDLAGLLVAARGLDSIADSGAIDQDTLLTMRRTRLGKSGIDIFVARHIDLAKHSADICGNGFALFLVHVEDRDLRTLGSERASSRLAQA